MATIRTAQIEVSAAALGAELTSIRSRDGTEYLWQGDPRFWASRSPVLFPIVGALPGGVFTHGGKSYGLGNHGFARKTEFTPAGEAGEELRYELRASQATLAQYPFRFALTVAYRASGRTLSVEWRVRNEDTEKMVFSIGAHPGFRAPLEAGETREDFELLFETRETVRRHFLNADNVRTGESEVFLNGEDRVPLTPALFERGAIVLMDHKSRELTLRSRKSGRFVRLRFSGFPYLGIWSPRGDTPFVCLEPWHGVMPLAGSSTELAAKEGCLGLEPGRDFTASYQIEVG
jgi:galactose mutarotase-like enzyme